MTQTMIIRENDVIALYVEFTNRSGGKRRPALALSYENQIITFYPITSKYANRSERIKAQYYPIKEWQSVGLTKPSYVDVGNELVSNISDVEVTRIGSLSALDIIGLKAFIANYLLNK
ncbi:MAG: hypothetical protein QM571_07550 [Micrococcaceae bacterium]